MGKKKPLKATKPRTKQAEVRYVLFDTFNETYAAFKTLGDLEKYVEEEYPNVEELSSNQLLVAEVDILQAVRIGAKTKVDGYDLVALSHL